MGDPDIDFPSKSAVTGSQCSVCDVGRAHIFWDVNIYKSICVSVPAKRKGGSFWSIIWALGHWNTIRGYAALVSLSALSLAKVHAACFLAACNNPCGFCFHFQKIAANAWHTRGWFISASASARAPSKMNSFHNCAAAVSKYICNPPSVMRATLDLEPRFIKINWILAELGAVCVASAAASHPVCYFILSKLAWIFNIYYTNSGARAGARKRRDNNTVIMICSKRVY